MKFIIQHNLMNHKLLDDTRNAVKDFPHQFVGVIPFGNDITSDEQLEGDDYIPYGSTLLTAYASRKYNWKGLFFDLDVFNYDAASKNRDDMLNGNNILPLIEAVDFLRKDHSSKEWFVRPSHDTKQFSGIVMNGHECADWFEDAILSPFGGTYKMDMDMPVVIAEKKKISAEWRYFIVDGKIVSGSMYMTHNQIRKERVIEDDILNEAQTLADKWLPSPCCVMDLALVENELKVIEFNCINSSGPYDNDIAIIFKKLYEYCTR